LSSDENHEYSDALARGDTEPIRKRSEGKAVLSSRPLCENQLRLQDTYGTSSKAIAEEVLVSKQRPGM
jgi:hypothetical protein